MNLKTAIIIGVLILVLPAVITPFFIGKNNNNEIIQNNISNNEDEIVENSSNNMEKDKDLSQDELLSEQTFNNVQKIDNNNEIKEENISNEVNTNVNSLDTRSSNVEVVNVGNEQNENVSSNSTDTNIDENIVENATTPVIPEGMVGILKIDKIGLCQNVAEGHTLDVLKKNLGHVTDTAQYTGNIGILGHNSGNAGYFKRLTELVVGDEIQYISNNGTRTYKVSEITQIDDTDWSKLANTEENKITLITCVKNVPLKRLCIQASEI